MRKTGVWILAGCLVILFFGALWLGFQEQNQETAPVLEGEGPKLEFPDDRFLHLETVEEEGEKQVIQLAAQPGSHGKGMVTLVDLSDAFVEVAWKTYPLGEALESGQISLEEIFGLAQLDAWEGLCKSSLWERKGQPVAIFSYPEYTLWFSGSQERTTYGTSQFLAQLYLCPPQEVGQTPQGEGWGLSFAVSQITPSGLSLEVRQSGGSFLGQLQLISYHIQKGDGSELDVKNSDKSHNLGLPLTRDGETQLHLDWTEVYGPLPEGDYRLTLQVEDNPGLPFEERQPFVLEVTIPQ